jgi:4-diphosphocytidyl-2-C-methyl-D-erythritol kinase
VAAGVPETVFAPAKINLYLHAGARRADGYHPLDSLVVFADLGDELRIEPGDGLSLSIDGPFAAALGAQSDNLVLRAARALAAHADIAPNARMTLAKNLPVAAGLGGGSADAASALRGLVRFWNFAIADTALQAIALSLGADVPACLAGVPLRMEGIGEKLTPLTNFPALDLVLVNPGIALSTAEVFARLERRSGTSRPVRPAHDRDALVARLERTRNDLEEPAASLAPEIREVIGALCSDPSVFIARMSGSGATCFGIYGDAQDAEAAAALIARRYPHWWVRATRTSSSA